MRRMKIKALPNLLVGNKKTSPAGRNPLLQPKQEPVEKIKNTTEDKLTSGNLNSNETHSVKANTNLSTYSNSSPDSKVGIPNLLENIQYSHTHTQVSEEKHQASSPNVLTHTVIERKSLLNPFPTSLNERVITQDESEVAAEDKTYSNSYVETSSSQVHSHSPVISESNEGPQSSAINIFGDSSTLLKNRSIIKPSINKNIINKMASRRTRIKGCPVVPSVKRPPVITKNLNNSETKDRSSESAKIPVLENKNNNEYTSEHNLSPKSLKSTEPPLKNFKNDSKDRAESKENIGVEKLKLKNLSNNKISIKTEDAIKEKVFHERKLKYRKKMSAGSLEKSQMTMFDLIFWNPATNPMPGRNESDPQRRRSNSVSSSVLGAESVASNTLEEQTIEDFGLDVKGNEIENKGQDKKPVIIDESDTKSQASQESEEEEDVDTGTVAPQVKIGPNGELIVDEKSLVIQTTAAKNRDEILSRTEVVEEGPDSSHYGKWSRRRKRATEWTRKETARFYKALSTVGTDFSLMETIFTWRSRSELKIKFKKEEKINRNLIDTALNDCTQFDFSVFDESDYDPEEDRKETKEAEKAEAKRKRELEREQKKLQKEQEKIIKKEQERIDKQRKKKLKTVYRKKKRKLSRNKDNGVEAKRRKPAVAIEAKEVICEVVFSARKEHNAVERNTTKVEDEGPEHAKDCPTTKSELKKEAITAAENSPKNNLLSINVAEDNPKGESSQTLEIVDVGDHARVILSPVPVRRQSPMDVSSSLFKVKDSSSITSDLYESRLEENQVVIPQVEINPSQISQVVSLPSGTIGIREEEGEALSFSSIPVFIDNQLYSSMYKDGIAPIDGAQHDPVLECEEENLEKIQQHSEHFQKPTSQEDENAENMQFCFPVNSVHKTSDGNQFVELETPGGIKKIAVPAFGPETSNIIVVSTKDPDNPLEHIYHVYTVVPLES